MKFRSGQRGRPWTRAIRAWETYVEPRSSGLPNWKVVSYFPLLLAGLTLLLVILQISGTSSGAHWFNLGTGADPRLLFGTPRTIRSDEWLVKQGWVVSQANQSWPSVNQIFPGGVDMTVLNELPSWDWSTIFRPHLWGYLILGLDAGVAWEWWVPGAALVGGCYLFLVTLLPKRPLTAALVSVSVFFTPLLQWFYGAGTLWPIAWCFIAMAGIVWMLNDSRPWVRAVWASVVGYVAVTMAMGLYIPFIIPVLIVFLSFGVGMLLRAKPWAHGGVRATLSALGPYIIAGVSALVVAIVWALTRLPTFDAISSTVYPGQRVESTGSLLGVDPYLTNIAGAPWNAALKGVSQATILGPNSSESSSVILLSVFLVPAMIIFLVSAFRVSKRLDPVLAASLVCMAVIGAYLLIPGWDWLAHIIQLDRVPAPRFKIAFVILLPLFVALVIDQVDKRRSRLSLVAGIASTAFALLLIGASWLTIKQVDPVLLALAIHWKWVVAAILIATLLLFVRKLVPVAGIALLVASVVIGWNVNPLYRGVFDLSETATGNTIEAVDHKDPGAWVGVGSFETMALLVETGVTSFSGVQTYPSEEMWHEIDPTGEFEPQWNRLAHVQWEMGAGDPVMTNPTPDVIRVSFDPCADFAQAHVEYVLSDEASVDSKCLRSLAVVPQGAVVMRVYEVLHESSK